LFRAPLQISTGFASWQRYCMASSSGPQPNFAALNRGRHLCLAGRPSRWALAHILVSNSFACTLAAIQQMIRRSRFECQLNRNQIKTENPITSLPATVRASRIAAKLAKSAKISVSLIFGLLLKSVCTVYTLTQTNNNQTAFAILCRTRC